MANIEIETIAVTCRKETPVPPMQPSILEHNFEKQISYHFLSHLSQMPTTPAYGNSEGTHHFFELSVGAPFKSWKNSFVLQALTLVNMHIQFCI